MNGLSMVVNGIYMDVVDIYVVVVGLVKWIKVFLYVVLIFYNGRRFDFFVFLKMVINIDKMGEFFDNVCVDLLIFY